jgi:hypothetical protein
VVVLNAWDPKAQQLVNNTKDAPLRIGLGEVPSTPAYRLQEQQNITQAITALTGVNPQAAAVLVPAWLESTSLPNRLELADDVRRTLGLPTAGDKAAAEKQQAQQAQEQEQQKALQQQAQMLAMRGEAAKVSKTEAETKKTLAQVDEVHTKSQLNLAQVVSLGHGMSLSAQEANKPEPQAAPEVPDEETPEMAHDRMIDEAINEARQARMQGAMQ